MSEYRVKKCTNLIKGKASFELQKKIIGHRKTEWILIDEFYSEQDAIEAAIRLKENGGNLMKEEIIYSTENKENQTYDNN